jgi:predicted O-methyltransferase YrrM
MKFTEDWFSNNIHTWKKYLSHYKNKPLNFLEIGTFEGRAAIWLLQNILTNPKSKLYVVDVWIDPAIYARFIKNIEPYKEKVVIMRGLSRDMLRQLKTPIFDFIYIDANRHSKNVLEDAVLSYPLLKSGAMMIFDDYTNNKEHDINCPKPGIDAFLNMYIQELKVLQTQWQVIVVKRAKHLPRKLCFSEFYKEPHKASEVQKKIMKKY